MTEIATKIKVGTSGYSFLDWIGPFYPTGIPRGGMLDYYVQHFNTVEINSSYYSIPHTRVYENMIKKVPPGFEFFVKAHKSMTHDRTDIMKPAAKFIESLKPLHEAKILGGVLLQFPFSFKFSPEGFTYLKRVCDLLFEQSIIIEFRHRGWVREEILDFLKKENATYCCVDEPQIEGLLEPDVFVTTHMCYIRLHGRNRQKWWSGGGERYDYLYDEKELMNWQKKINDIKRETHRIYIFFNNCHHGQAVANAKMMLDLLQTNIGETA